MKTFLAHLDVSLALVAAGVAHADNSSDTIQICRTAAESAAYLRHSHACARLPTVGDAGFNAGAAIGKGQVYAHHPLDGDTTMTPLSASFHAGGKTYGQHIFFQDQRSLEKFESGSFRFSVGASVTAITAAAGGSSGTTEVTTSASVPVNTAPMASALPGYTKSMAIFSIAKAALMYVSILADQRYSFTQREAK